MSLLTDRFTDAVAMAQRFHPGTRKGADNHVPYVAHLLAVTALVLEMGGDEQVAIAALLHDAVEDAETVAEREEARREIAAAFGAEVLALVEHVSEPVAETRPPWRERKQAYLDHLRSADDGDNAWLLIALADKLHNSRATLRVAEAERWARFNAGRDEQRWWYESLVAAFAERQRDLPGLEPFVNELAQTVREVFTGE